MCVKEETDLLVHWVDGDGQSRVVPLHLLAVVAGTRDVGGGGSGSSMAAPTAVTTRVTDTTHSKSHKHKDEAETWEHHGNHHT